MPCCAVACRRVAVPQSQPSLPTNRAFVVQFRTPSTGASPYIGRVEHVVSGQVEELLGFMVSVLADVQAQSDSPGACHEPVLDTAPRHRSVMTHTRVCERIPEYEVHFGGSIGLASGSFMLYLADMLGIFGRAVERGREPTAPCGEAS